MNGTTLPALLLPLLLLAPPAVAQDVDPGLERALASVSPENIAADLHFIASDELQGRDTPSRGQRIAARFLRARLQRLGWQPGAENGYFYEYTLPMYALQREGSHLALRVGEERRPLELGGDWAVFPGLAGTCAVEGEVVFAGDWTREGGEELEVEGRWVLCTTGAGDFRERLSMARRGDAAGVLVADPLEGPDEIGERCRGYAEQLVEPRLGKPRSRSSTPYVYLSRTGFRALLDAAGVESPTVGTVLPVGLDLALAFGDAEGSVLENVCGLWPGADPELRDEVIIVSAHYDHVGTVEQTGEVFNGADDNGSGTCGLLAVAEALAARGPLARTVLLMWVSGEEKGLYGSEAWTKDPWLPEGMKPILNLNIDMIGRNAPEQILVTPTSDHKAYNFLTRLVERHAPTEGFTDLGSADAYWSRSDHKNFSENLDLPVAFLFSDVHEDYHKTTDTPDKIDYDKLSRVVRLVVRMLHDLQEPHIEGR